MSIQSIIKIDVMTMNQTTNINKIKIYKGKDYNFILLLKI